MKLKNILLIIVACVIGVNITSCSDSFLDEKPFSKYSPESIKDANGIEAAVKGLHYTLGSLWACSWPQGFLCCWQVGTDVATPGNIEGIEYPFFQYQQMVPGIHGASIPWEKYYKIVSDANSIIAETESSETTIEESVLKTANGEAKFFRAYAYNMLATLWGGVPLILDPINEPKIDFTRASLDEVNAQIEKDLKSAIEDLPETGKTDGRISKDIARQLLGELYIRMNRGQDAVDVLSVITQSGKYSLVKNRYGVKTGEPGDYYSDMFIQGNMRRSQGNTEAIWTFEVEDHLKITGGYPGQDAPQQRRVWVPYYQDMGMLTCDSLGGRGIGRMRISSWVTYSLYDADDIRNSPHNIRRQYYMNNPEKDNYGELIPYESSDTLFKIAPSITKWNDFDVNEDYGWGTKKDWQLMRLGETYLLLAEAYLQTGDKAKAADAINELRKRAFGDKYETKGKVSASDIDLDFILDERARELIGEENRRATLMRTKTLVERAKLNTDKANPITGLTETHLLLPIPLTEIQLNSGAELKQNPGY
jgi:hypothetical protein